MSHHMIAQCYIQWLWLLELYDLCGECMKGKSRVRAGWADTSVMLIASAKIGRD